MLRGIQDAALLAGYDEEASIEVMADIGGRVLLPLETVTFRGTRPWDDEPAIDDKNAID